MSEKCPKCKSEQVLVGEGFYVCQRCHRQWSWPSEHTDLKAENAALREQLVEAVRRLAAYAVSGEIITKAAKHLKKQLSEAEAKGVRKGLEDAAAILNREPFGNGTNQEHRQITQWGARCIAKIRLAKPDKNGAE